MRSRVHGRLAAPRALSCPAKCTPCLTVFVSIIIFSNLSKVDATNDTGEGLLPSAFTSDSPQGCPPGRYPLSLTESALGGVICAPCDSDSYKSDWGNFNCTSCPDGSRTGENGAIRLSDCLCSPGLYRPEVFFGDSEHLNNRSCSICPSGGVCEGYRNGIEAQNGYWLDIVPTGESSIRFEILACFGYQNCLGNNTCTTGRGDNLCSLCAFDNGNREGGTYFSFFGSCRKCFSTAVNVLVHIGVYLSWIFLNLFVAHQYTVVALAIDWMQLLAIIGNINAGWPESVQWFLNAARFFSFDLDIVSWQCISSWNFFWEMLLQFSLPFALSLFWILLLCPSILYNALKKRPECVQFRRILRTDAKNENELLHVLQTKIWNPLKSLLATLGFFDIFHEDINFNFLKAKILVSFESTYVISTYYALASLSYRHIGGKRVVFNAPYYEFNTECIVLGTLGLIFLSIGFPLYMFVKCMGFRPRNDEDPGKFGDNEVRETYEWFYARFRISKWKLAYCAFIHRILQICAVVFIGDPGMALNVSFVINILFGLFVGLQHPNISLKLNAIEYLTMFSTVATVLCGMWFNWLNAARDYSTNTSRVLLDDIWSRTWLSNLVEICALVNLSLTCFLFLYATLLEFVDIRCYAKSLYDLLGLSKEIPSNRRDDLYWSLKRLKDGDGSLAEYLHPIALRSWVDMILKQYHGRDEEDRQQSRQLICDFCNTSYAIRKFVEEHPRSNPFSLSKDAVLWRELLSNYPALLSFLLSAQDSLKKAFITFFKEYYSRYWKPSRRSLSRFFLTIPGWQEMGSFLNGMGSSDVTPPLDESCNSSSSDTLFGTYQEELINEFNQGRGDNRSLCGDCREKMERLLQDHLPQGNQVEQGSLESRQENAISAFCRRVVLHCTSGYCNEIHATEYVVSDLRRRPLTRQRSSSGGLIGALGGESDLPDNLASLLKWTQCPPDVSIIIQRRYRAPLATWLARISMVESDEEDYAKRMAERMRFMRLIKSILENKHKSAMEKFGRALMLGNMTVFSSSETTPRNLDEVFEDLDSDVWTQPCTLNQCNYSNFV